MLLPNLRLNEGSKKAFSIQCLAGHGSMCIDVADIDMDSQVLATIPTTIRDILKGVKLLISYDARRLLVSFFDVPFHMWHLC